MQIVEFYRGERGNQSGHTLAEIMLWPDHALEVDHDWVQWVLPSNEPSMFNGEAPTMTKAEADVFEADPELREAVRQSFVRFLQFLEFRLARDDEAVAIEAVVGTPEWLRSFNHTMLRVTRCLKCLRLTGNVRYAVAFLDALRLFRAQVSDNTWKYWQRAVTEPLWP